jgi:glycosyltransferase involved in cell wall biosynthesis
LSKVIIIGPAYPLRGGLATFNERLARQFMAEGHETIIYTFSLQYPNFLFPGKTQYSESGPPANLDIRVRINSINPSNWLSVGNELRNLNPDIIIVRYWLPFMGPCLGTILRIAKRNHDTKIVGLIDNALPHERRFGDRSFTKYFTACLDGLVTMSEHVKNDLKQFTSKPTHLVQHPLYDNFGPKLDKEKARCELKIPKDKYVFLFFGFIRKYKGLDLLIQALDYLPNIIKGKICILIAGEFYAGEDEIKAQIAHSTSKSIILAHTHFINDEQVASYFSASDCVIQPYRNATQSGVTPLAYHFEVPLIVTNVGALPDLVPPNLGLVCEPNAENIAQTMVKMLDFDTARFAEQIVIEKKKLSWAQLSMTLFKATQN